MFPQKCVASSHLLYTPARRKGAMLQSPCPSVCLSIRSHFRNRYLSFYWKKWFYIWYMALAWWLVPCLPFPGLPQFYFLFTVRLTNERVGVFLARRSVHHLVLICIWSVSLPLRLSTIILWASILLQLMWGSIMWASLVTWCPSSVNFLHFDLFKNHWTKMDQTQIWLLEWSSSKIESGDLAWHLKWPWPLCLLVESLDTCRILVSVLARIWK